MSFPQNPNDGDLYTNPLSTVFVYDSTREVWLIDNNTITGATGIQGPQGTQGTQGETGIAGIQGPQGVTGLIGETGLQGAAGAIGATGIQGLTGLIGLTGLQGSAGSAGAVGATGIEGQYWRGMPATPTLISNKQFKLSGDHSQLLSRGTVFKWQDSTGVKHAMDASSNITGTDTTVNVIGDLFAAWDFTAANMRYAVEKARMVNFSIPGTQATGYDQAGHFYAPYSMHVFGCDVFVSTAGTTNNTAYDVTQGSSSMFTVKPYITSGNTSGISMTADNSQVVAAGTALNVGTYNVSTAPPVDGWIQLYFTPEKNSRL